MNNYYCFYSYDRERIQKKKHIVTSSVAKRGMLQLLLMIPVEFDVHKKIQLKWVQIESENVFKRDGGNNENAIFGNSNVQSSEYIATFYGDNERKYVYIQNRCIK